MQRAYFKWFSPNLQKDMELLVFGYSGPRILFFPTRGARFFDYEDWKVLDLIAPQIDSGQYQVICVDSVDKESFYNREAQPAERIARHLQYEEYILQEILPFTLKANPDSLLYAAGCSLGAYHAVNIAFKHPQLFSKVIGMSGRYDLTVQQGNFIDLFDGYNDNDIYFNSPNKYIANLTDDNILTNLKQLDIIIAIGNEDAFLGDSQYLSQLLWSKDVWNALHIWEGEAHKPRFWQRMVQSYF